MENLVIDVKKNRHQTFVFLVTIFSLQIVLIVPNFKLKLLIIFGLISLESPHYAC